MVNASPRPNRSASAADYLWAFASRRQCWIVLARNLIPVVGVYGFSWSVAMTTFNYWFDGITALAALLAATITRAMIEAKRAAPAASLLRMIGGGVLLWVIVFGLCGMPYWFLLDSVSHVLQLPAIAAEIQAAPTLWLTFGALALSQFWRAFVAGYLSMPLAQLKQRVQTDFFALIARAVTMEVIASGGFAIVPLLALAVTYIEISPDLQSALLERHRAEGEGAPVKEPVGK